MRIGKRLFPYPLLNNEKLFSQYKNSTFEMKYEDIVLENETYTMKNIAYCNDNEYLNQLIGEGKVIVVCLVECAETMYRQTFPLRTDPQDICISLCDINGKMTISAFAVATEDIPDYYCDEFLEDYEGISFYIEKNDILAVDDGIVDRIIFEGFDDDKKSSIFLVIKDTAIQDGVATTEYNQNKIIISLPETQWNQYDKTKGIAGFRNMYFSIIAIPALSWSLSELQKSSDSVDVLTMDYDWFNAFAQRYSEIHKEELTDDLFTKMNPYMEAQLVLNASVTKSIDDVFSIAMGAANFGGEEDGD